MVLEHDDPLGPEYPTLDHVTPHSQGGEAKLRNLLLKHRACNDARRNAPPTEADLQWQQRVWDEINKRSRR
jgi:5-methylcytosine-specific restriction endonuclease McrA